MHTRTLLQLYVNAMIQLNANKHVSKKYFLYIEYVLNLHLDVIIYQTTERHTDHRF